MAPKEHPADRSVNSDQDAHLNQQSRHPRRSWAANPSEPSRAIKAQPHPALPGHTQELTDRGSVSSSCRSSAAPPSSAAKMSSPTAVLRSLSLSTRFDTHPSNSSAMIRPYEVATACDARLAGSVGHSPGRPERTTCSYAVLGIDVHPPTRVQAGVQVPPQDARAWTAAVVGGVRTSPLPPGRRS